MNNEEQARRLQLILDDISRETRARQEEFDRIQSINQSIRTELEQDSVSKLDFSIEQQSDEYQMLEKENAMLRAEIASLKKQKKDVQDNYKKEVIAYVAHVEKMCGNEHDAIKIYTENGLLEDVQKIKAEMAKAAEKLKKGEEELKEVNAEVKEVSKSAYPEREMAVSLENRRMIMGMFRDENDGARQTLDEKREKRKQLRK